jgi:hypothetical protein
LFNLVIPSALSLTRRHTSEPAIIQLRAFNCTIVDVDVACDPSTETLCPIDRIVTVKGLATVRGRDPSTGRFWVETDDAYALNLGVVLLSGDWFLVRRCGPFFMTNGRKVNVNHLKQYHAIPGDVVSYDFREFLIVGELDQEQKYILKEIANGQTVIVEIGEPSLEIVARGEFPSERVCEDLTGQQFMIRTDLNDFRGTGMKPGDVLEFNLPDGKRKGKVIGSAMNEIWVQFDGNLGASCLRMPYSARSSSRVVERLTASIATWGADEYRNGGCKKV